MYLTRGKEFAIDSDFSNNFSFDLEIQSGNNSNFVSARQNFSDLQRGNLDGRVFTLLCKGGLAAAGCYCICIVSVALLIGGGIMKGICPNTEKEGCSQLLVNLSNIFLIAGGCLLPTAICCGCAAGSYFRNLCNSSW